MFELKDPKIKLFGTTIQLPETSTAAAAAVIGGGHDSFLSQEPPCSSNSCNPEDGDFNAEEQYGSLKSNLCSKQDYTNVEENRDRSSPSPEENKDFNNQSLPSVDDSKTDEDPSESETAQEKTLRKPDKIIPCPRCNSMDTKFCYFNNYNVNQPRHFCKNCQRYWTIGGMMRNVPVGAGRRKNKNTASQIHHLTIPPNGVHHHNGTLLTFNTDSPLCESMVSTLNIADQNCSQNRARDPVSDEDNPRGSPSPQGETGLSRLSGPDPKYHPFPQLCYPGAPWPYPIHLGPSSFPLPFYSTTPPYFSSVAPHYSWNAHCIYPYSGPMSQVPLDPGPTSPTLGKHSREETIPKPADQDEGKQDTGNLWVPKTLRIDDPGNAAAKSLIWATLGIKNEGSDSIGGGGLIKALQSRSKVEERMKDRENSAILQANPAALSRSIQFHESM